MIITTKENRISPAIWIIIGFLLYEFSIILNIFDGSDRILKIFGILIIFIFVFSSKRTRLSGITKKGLGLLFLIEILMILIGLYNIACLNDPYNGSFRQLLSDLLFFTHSPLTLLIPFAAFLPFSPSDFKHLKQIALIVVIIQIIAVVIYRNDIFTRNLTGFTSLVSYTGEYISKRELVMGIFSSIGIIAFFTWNRKYINAKLYLLLFFGLCLSFICIASGGGRGSSAIMFGYIFTTILFHNPKSNFKIYKIFIFLMLLIVLLIYLFNNTNIFSYLSTRLFNDDSFSTLRESTREDFTNAMVSDFNSNPSAWLFGRGIYGSYILPNGEYRQWMEWGFLYQILKGGIIYLFVFVGLLLYSFKNAFFKSNNTFCKSMGFLCLWQVISLIPFGLPSMTTQYFLVWWFVGIISKKEIREMNDNEIIIYFNSK